MPEQLFSYNASALGLGGLITHPNGAKTVIPSLASVALAPTGGEGWAVVENYDRDGVSFTKAESRVIGTQINNSSLYSTYTDLYITNLALFGTVRIALMQATVTSERDIDVDDDSRFSLHAIFRGVEVGNEEVIPVLDIDLCQSATFADAIATIKRCTQPPSTALETKRLAAIKLGHEPILSSVVSEVKRRDSISRGRGHMLSVPGFGNVHFGELLLKRGRRRLNLLRLDLDPRPENDMLAFDALGTGDVGSLTVGSSDTNGLPIWPKP